MKNISRLFLITILSSALLFSCGKCDSPFGFMVMDRPIDVNDVICFSILQESSDTTDILYDSIISPQDLFFFEINDNNSMDSMKFWVNMDSTTQRGIIHPYCLFNRHHEGNLKTLFKLKIASKDYSIPINFTQTIDDDDCSKRNTSISSIIISSVDYEIIITEDNYGEGEFKKYYITLILPSSSE